MNSPAAGFSSFRDFYPYYLSEHADRTCRRLHFVGTTLVIAIVVTSVATGNLSWLLLAPVAGYGFAWIGHFVFEKKPSGYLQVPVLQPLGRLCDVQGHVDWQNPVLTIPVMKRPFMTILSELIPDPC